MSFESRPDITREQELRSLPYISNLLNMQAQPLTASKLADRATYIHDRAAENSAWQMYVQILEL